MPGEITLAHRGLLFLDELPEFRREALEALRQPLETGDITISRAGTRLDLPARFQLVAAMNPCPCGYRGHSRIPCHCGTSTVARYRRRISGPLLDRVELRLELQAPEFGELVGERGSAPGAPGMNGAGTGLEHAELVELAHVARERMLERQGERRNADLNTRELDGWSKLDAASLDLLEEVATRRSLSARALQALRRVARTLADLEGAELVELPHVAEALALRGELGVGVVQ